MCVNSICCNCCNDRQFVVWQFVFQFFIFFISGWSTKYPALPPAEFRWNWVVQNTRIVLISVDLFGAWFLHSYSWYKPHIKLACKKLTDLRNLAAFSCSCVGFRIWESVFCVLLFGHNVRLNWFFVWKPPSWLRLNL